MNSAVLANIARSLVKMKTVTQSLQKKSQIFPQQKKKYSQISKNDIFKEFSYKNTFTLPTQLDFIKDIQPHKTEQINYLPFQYNINSLIYPQIDYAKSALLSTKRGRDNESGYLYPNITAMYGNVNYIKNLQNYYM